MSIIRLKIDMSLKFITNAERQTDELDWGNMTWLSNLKLTDAKQLVVIEVNLAPGKGHDFHRHPNQEEVIYVIQGQIEQWVDQEKRLLSFGESAFFPANGVHASFNVGDQPAKVLAILSPNIGEGGYELEEVYHEAPWNTLRQ